IVFVEIQIEEQPISASVPTGYSLTLRCRAIGSSFLQYQWFQKKRSDILGANQAEFHITATKTQLYVCRVNNEQNNCNFSNWVKVKVHQTSAILPVLWQGEPVIALNPKPAVLKAGRELQLRCVALGIPAPSYQWYKNGNPLLSQKKEELQIPVTKVSDHGTYLCCVSNARGEHWTEPVDINIACNQIFPKIASLATDKVALLVGNNMYRSHPNLVAPMMDIYKLAILLQQLDFRVVSLLDLTKEEMLTAVHQFLQLLGKGVYALFYYAGHGYERSGRNYMVPVDAPQPYRPENCISVQRILQKMQERETALNVVLLDTCRKWYNPDCPLSEVRPLEPLGNVVYGYATSEDAEAYEVQDGEYSSGIFMKYLKKHILKEEKVTHVLEKVLEDIGRDPLIAGKQVMEIKHTLKEGRALTDKIYTAGGTAQFKKLWERAPELPKKRTVEFACGVEVELGFSAAFSNVMHIFAKIKKKGLHLTDCRILLYKPPEMDAFVRSNSGSDRADSLLSSLNSEEESDSMLRLYGLQKLQKNLKIKMDLHYTDSNCQQRVHESMEINLGRPLIAKLNGREDSASPSHQEQQGPVTKYQSKRSLQHHRVPPNTGWTCRPGTRKAENRHGCSHFRSQMERLNEPEENDESEILNLNH
uniref:MALT1 paracaspase n=1 Tax=Latimeria chalumnae TaxID=7897 RepID=H3B7Z3_LATCH